MAHTRAAIAGAALILLLVGCGGGDADTEADDPAASESTSSEAATDEPTESESESAEPAGDIDPADFAQQLVDGIEGSTTAQVRSETKAGGLTISSEGVVDYSATPPNMSMTTDNPVTGGTMEIRLVDGAYYMKMGEQSQGKFIKIDLNDPDSPFGNPEELTQGLNPKDSVEQFANATTSVEDLGEEDVDGESLQHFRLTVDPAKIEGLDGAGSQALPEELLYDIWVDDDFRTRIVETDLGTAGSSRTEMSNWGEPVTIEAPPADQILQLPGR